MCSANGKLEVLIATHEHWDHLSGFHGHQKKFEEIKPRRVWLAWTENPDDPKAREIMKMGVFYETAEQTLEANGFAPNRKGGNQGFLRKSA